LIPLERKGWYKRRGGLLCPVSQKERRRGEDPLYLLVKSAGRRKVALIGEGELIGRFATNFFQEITFLKLPPSGNSKEKEEREAGSLRKGKKKESWLAAPLLYFREGKKKGRAFPFYHSSKRKRGKRYLRRERNCAGFLFTQRGTTGGAPHSSLSKKRKGG